VTTVIGPLLNSRGISAEQLGFLNSMNWAVITLASVPAGRLSDEVGRLLPFLVSAGTASVGWALLILRTDFIFSTVAFLAAGLSLALFTPNSTALISESCPIAVAPIYFALFHMVTWGCAALASAASGWASGSLGAESPLLMASVLYAMSGAALMLSARRASHKSSNLGGTGTRGALHAIDLRGAVTTIRSNRLLAFYGFGLFFHTFGFLMITPYLSLYAEKIIGLDMAGVGLVMAAWNGGLMVGLLPWAWASTKKGREAILVAHFILSAVTWSAVTLSQDLVSSMFIMFVFGIVGSMDLPARRTLTAELSSPEKLAEATGFIELATGIGGLTGSLLGGVLWERLGPTFPFYAGSLMTLLSVAPMLKLAARVKNRTMTAGGTS